MSKSTFKQNLYIWAESYFYRPNFTQKLLSFILLPLSLIYAFVIYIKKYTSKEKDLGIKILSIGNLSLGGSGKTPLGIAIANEFDGAFIILRGYGRSSKGLVKVCVNGQILTDVKTSGDEAMEYAISVKNTNVIVSENRDEAIYEAKKMGARYIILDDGFGKFHIKKFNILIQPNPLPALNFTIPSGAYRYPVGFYRFGDFIAKEGVSHFRKTQIFNQTDKMLLVTAIANPTRLEPFFNQTVAQIFYPDHHDFNKQELAKLLSSYKATSLLMTQKDFVKVKDFNLPISLIKLHTTLSNELKNAIKQAI
ncbi:MULTISPECIES: tetraacyldisaccharide 4'-kinase [Campylobacter]|uniref:Tetraacyldisaccharide 4'-kinase n=1 Tax=Campylobacter californiensis TaxID=1032243 RepID=A0ABD4JKB7_9BACT|nr:MULTISPECIES: tetraacyldisaccharide 4'-kinase [unclassified Campylobacter]MBE2987165.1 tetraacyldisaccharide 4'-kinase [Campylobacter sp. RM12919]MBE2987660.1 tetraacyldisaccharide 4'-kinase [Campylobacter sp. RM12920]MBE3022303.1 tetraacyldisaccharide 4'-kinase [Campylobacter sp. 7477a]MBE3605868.1 tetraacyldisaccharide 4'-kinase [Campylobacter sp. RM13119]MBE3609985.1 tetraacyldisaccharide 4'-kinase [Campylobacter sp. RM12916]